MSRGFGHKTRLFVLCTTIVGTAGSVVAAPRRVAVVNVASTQKAGAAASAAFRGRLDKTKTLVALPTGLLATALESEIPTTAPSVARLTRARMLVAQAADARGRFADDEALAYLVRAERTLLSVVPDQEWLAAMAKLNLLSGRIVLARPARAEAQALFQLVATLDPTLTSLDPAVFTPAEVKLYGQAIKARRATAKVSVSASYDGASIWIDGKEAGVAPTTLTVTAGLHYVAAVFKDHTPEVQKVQWYPGKKSTLSLRLHPMSTDARARALRRTLLSSNVPSAAAVLNAARDAATLAGVDAVALIRTGTRGIEVAIYDGRADRLGPWRPQLTPSTTLLAALLPPPKPKPKPIIITPPPLPPPPPPVWYRKRWAQALIGSGVAATILGGILINRSSDNGAKMVAPPVFGGF